MTPDPRNVRDALLEAGYSAEEVELGLRALNHGKQDQDDLSEAYYWLCAVMGWTFVKDRKVADPRTNILRAARHLWEYGVWRNETFDYERKATDQWIQRIRAFGTPTP